MNSITFLTCTHILGREAALSLGVCVITLPMLSFRAERGISL